MTWRIDLELQGQQQMWRVLHREGSFWDQSPKVVPASSASCGGHNKKKIVK
jgi:hypothetical protein